MSDFIKKKKASKIRFQKSLRVFVKFINVIKHYFILLFQLFQLLI